jgi:hypothetical protein
MKFGQIGKRVALEPRLSETLNGDIRDISQHPKGSSLMTQYVVNPAVVHKHQTKANDCWYACVQMLQTWKHGGGKVKPQGIHTMQLHSGLLGHRLTADWNNSKHFAQVLHENHLRRLRASGIDFGNLNSVENALRNYGPIMVGGTYGELLRHLIKGEGHYIVVAGTDNTNNNKILVFDPWHSQPHWMDQNWVRQNAWHDDDSQIVCE